MNRNLVLLTPSAWDILRFLSLNSELSESRRNRTLFRLWAQENNDSTLAAKILA